MTINDTLPIGLKFFCSNARLWVSFLVIGLCFTSQAKPQRVHCVWSEETNEAVQDSYLRTADLLVKRAELQVLNVSRVMHGFKMFSLSGSFKKGAYQKIDELAVSVDPTVMGLASIAFIKTVG